MDCHLHAGSGTGVQRPTHGCTGAWRVDYRIAGKHGAGAGPGTYVKPLEGKLWEMHLHGRDGSARALYFAHVGRRLCVVRVFMKKTQKTPRREIELALRRIAQVERDEDV